MRKNKYKTTVDALRSAVSSPYSCMFRVCIYDTPLPVRIYTYTHRDSASTRARVLVLCAVLLLGSR